MLSHNMLGIEPVAFRLINMCLTACLQGVLSYHAYEEGNISLLIRGYDSYGNICGHENEPIEGVPNSGLNMTDKG